MLGDRSSSLELYVSLLSRLCHRNIAISSWPLSRLVNTTCEVNHVSPRTVHFSRGGDSTVHQAKRRQSVDEPRESRSFIAHGLQPPGINIQETDAPQMADMQRQTGCAWVFLFLKVWGEEKGWGERGEHV